MNWRGRYEPRALSVQSSWVCHFFPGVSADERRLGCNQPTRIARNRVDETSRRKIDLGSRFVRKNVFTSYGCSVCKKGEMAKKTATRFAKRVLSAIHAFCSSSWDGWRAQTNAREARQHPRVQAFGPKSVVVRSWIKPEPLASCDSRPPLGSARDKPYLAHLPTLRTRRGNRKIS